MYTFTVTLYVARLTTTVKRTVPSVTTIIYRFTTTIFWFNNISIVIVGYLWLQSKGAKIDDFLCHRIIRSYFNILIHIYGFFFPSLSFQLIFLFSFCCFEYIVALPFCFIYLLFHLFIYLFFLLSVYDITRKSPSELPYVFTDLIVFIVHLPQFLAFYVLSDAKYTNKSFLLNRNTRLN